MLTPNLVIIMALYCTASECDAVVAAILACTSMNDLIHVILHHPGGSEGRVLCITVAAFAAVS